MMGTLTVVFTEPLHHICLMQGLKHTFKQMPFLNKKVLEIGGRVVTMDSMVAPPPMMRRATRVSPNRKLRTIVEVSYWRERLTVEYRDDMCSASEAEAFLRTLVQDYHQVRYPFMKSEFRENRYVEPATGHLLAEIS